MGKKMVKVVCDNCLIEFEKAKTEIKRSKTGSNFCGLSCNMKKRNESMPRNTPATLKHLKSMRRTANPMSCFMNSARRRQSRKGPTDLTNDYLMTIWDSQEGICPISGINLILPNPQGKWTESKRYERASLDRIDNSLGYVKGNVRFVSTIANLARNSGTDEDLIEFCRLVTKNKKELKLVED